MALSWKVSMLPSNHSGSPSSQRTKGSSLSIGRRYTAPRVVRGPVDAVTSTVSPATATARQYEACKPAVVKRNVRPLSVL